MAGTSEVYRERYTIATQIKNIFQERCSYPDPTKSYLIPIDLPKARTVGTPLGKRTEIFQVLDPGPVSLRGHRAFTDQIGQFFLDNSLEASWSRAAYVQRFANDVLYEDYRAQFQDDEVLLAPLIDPVEIAEPVLCLCAAEPSNYGSWLFRFLPKLSSLPDNDRPLFVDARLKWQFDLLDFFAPGRRVIPQKTAQGYRLRDAHIATMRNEGVFFDEQTKAFYRETGARVCGKSRVAKIYLSRATQKIRPMLNEGALEDKMKEAGFEIVQPENLSVEERIRVIRDAEVIACPGGSGLFNMVFAQNARLVIDIESNPTWIYAHARILESLGLPHVILFGDPTEVGSPHSPWLAPVDQIMTAIARLVR